MSIFIPAWIPFLPQPPLPSSCLQLWEKWLVFICFEFTPVAGGRQRVKAGEGAESLLPRTGQLYVGRAEELAVLAASTLQK